MNEDTRDTYNKIAEDWYRDHNADDWWHKGTDYLLSNLAEGSSVLDVGCGAGQKSRYISQKGFKVTGIDNSEKMIEICKRESKNIYFYVLDMYDLDKVNEKYDCVFSQASLLHIKKVDAPNIINKMLSILREGGFIYLAVKGKKDGGPEEEVLKESDYGYEYERFFSYYTMDELKKYFIDLNINIINTISEQVGNTTWLQIIGKK